MKSRVILAILFIIPMIPTSTVMSSYYVGNQYVSAYGGKVNIFTPSDPIKSFSLWAIELDFTAITLLDSNWVEVLFGVSISRKIRRVLFSCEQL